ncbi:MAG: hypothetical protein EKK71_16105 [Candidatus Competibacteraceae bacterium]|nr:MAG: hypothetical protein EKK71_16105 [Candidatus Competibacteraceae bacterium]
MNAIITRLAAASGVPQRRLVSGTLSASDWIALMAAYHHLAADLDAAEQDELDTLLDRLEAGIPMEVSP